MAVPVRRPRALPIALAGLGVVALVAGCADQVPGEAAAQSSSEAPPAEDELSTEDELAGALLPPEAFGPDASVVTVDVRQLSTSGTGGLPPGGSITPPECGQSVGSTQLTPEDFGVIVAQTATGPTALTVQVLAESERQQPDGGGESFDELLARCPEVTVDAPDGTTATVTFTELAVPDLGDASGGVAFSTAVQAPDGSSLTIPSLMAVATDGRRQLFLQQTGTGPAPLDEAAFTALFEDAFEAQQQD